MSYRPINAVRPTVGSVYRGTKNKGNGGGPIFYRIESQPSLDEYEVTSFSPLSKQHPRAHRPRVQWTSLRTRGLVEVKGDDIPDELWSGPPRMRSSPATGSPAKRVTVDVSVHASLIKDLLEELQDFYTRETGVLASTVLARAQEMSFLAYELRREAEFALHKAEVSP